MSTAVMATGIATLDLIVPVELTDQPLASDRTDITFESTQTSFDPDDYDGTRTYALEVVAMNHDTSNRSLKWLDWHGTEVGEVVIPGNSTEPTLFKNSITIPSGVSAYRIKIEGTSEAGQLQVLSARLMVKQVGATRTKLYFPLLSKASTPSASDSLNPLHSTSSMDYLTLAQSQRFTRNLASQSTLGEFNSWELEAVVSSQQDAIGSFALRNLSQDALVEDSQTYFKSQTVTLSRVPISEGLDYFSSANEGNQYDIVVRCDRNCTNQVQIYKAGLWLKVQNLSKVEVLQRLTLGASYPDGPAVLADSRAVVDLGGYSNPKFGLSVAASTPMMTLLDVLLSSAGSSSSSTTGLNPIAGSNLSFGLPDMTTQTTPMNLNLTNGDHLVVEVNGPAGAVVREAGLLIQAHR
jgi:hypothetical protein